MLMVAAARGSASTGGVPRRNSAEPRRLAAAVILACISGCGGSPTTPSEVRTFAFDFARGTQGWIAGFTDYPPGREEDMELLADHRPLPAPLDQLRGGLFISGRNRSDDLFMFWKGRVTGLRSDRTYTVEFTVEFATNVPKGVGGAGGRPDGSVFVKVGSSRVEPAPLLNPGGQCPPYPYYCLSLDKGNQSQGGADAVVVGTAGNLSGTETWELKELRSGPTPLAVTPNSDGSAWLLVGTDSGFEGQTSLYYTRVVAQFTPR